jgi:guanylate kinase
VVARLLQMEPNLWLSRSWTTRPRRPGEPEDAYVFVDRDTFLDRVAAGGFLEWTEFPATGALMGTPVFDAARTGDVVLEIDLDGARQVKQRYPDAALVFVVTPSAAEQEARLRKRGDDDEAVARRIDFGTAEEHEGRRVADAVVVNDDIDRAAAEVQAILHGLRGEAR